MDAVSNFSIFKWDNLKLFHNYLLFKLKRWSKFDPHGWSLYKRLSFGFTLFIEEQNNKTKSPRKFTWDTKSINAIASEFQTYE